MVGKFRQEDLEQKLKDGKIMAAAPRKEESFVSHKKKGGKKPRTANQQESRESGPFVIDFHLVNWFGLVGISPPNSKEDLDAKIEELQKLKAELENDGAAGDLDKEMEGLDKAVEAEVRKEFEAERREADRQNEEYRDEYYPER